MALSTFKRIRSIQMNRAKVVAILIAAVISTAAFGQTQVLAPNVEQRATAPATPLNFSFFGTTGGAVGTLYWAAQNPAGSRYFGF